MKYKKEGKFMEKTVLNLFRIHKLTFEKNFQKKLVNFDPFVSVFESFRYSIVADDLGAIQR